MATSPNATPTPITPPRVPLIDERTGLIDRAWYLFFLSLFRASETVDNATLGINAESLMASYDAALRALAQTAETQPPQVDCCVSVDAVRQEIQTQPVSGVPELAQEVSDLRQEMQTLPRPQLGTFASLQQANLPWTTFDTTASGVPPDIGTVAWDGGTTLGVQMTADVLLKVGEAEYVYAKASATITKGQVCYHTGAVGSSGVITVAPASIGLTDPNQIVGVAAESIALNGFGLIQISGDLRGFDTTGSSVGETWADGDPLYYNPAYVGSMTKVKPVAPNQKTYMGEVINAGSGGSGSMHIRITPGSVLGGTDSNVQFGTLANNDLIQYSTTLGYWRNVTTASVTVGIATNLAGGLVGSLPYQTGAGATTFLGIGAANTVLTSSGTAPQWSTALTGLTGISTTTLTTSSTVTLNGGTANGVLYLNGSKVATSGTDLVFNATGLGIGTSAPASKLNVDGTTALSWTAGATSLGLVTVGTQGTGGSLFLNTPSLNSSFASGLGIDGSYSGGTSTINIKAFGVNSGGPYGSNLAFFTSSTTSSTEKMRLDSSGQLFLGTTSKTVGAPSGIIADFRGGLALSAGSAVNGAYQELIFPAGVYAKCSIRGYSTGTTDAGELRFYTAPAGDVITERARITSAGSFVAGGSVALLTGATDGFLYVPTCAGTPTGTPTAFTGMAPIVVDTTNNKLYFYSGGAWRDAGP